MGDPRVSVAFVGDNTQFMRALSSTTAGVGTFNQRIRAMGAGSGEAAAGLTKASNAVNNLAGNLLGANSQVAKLAEGLLTGLAGGPVVAALGALIAVAVGGWELWTKKAREAKKATDELLESAFKASAIGKREETDKSITAAKLRVAELRAELEENERTVNVLGNSFGLSADKLRKLNRELFEAKVALQQLRGGAVELPEITTTVAGPVKALEAEIAALGQLATADHLHGTDIARLKHLETELQAIVKTGTGAYEDRVRAIGTGPGAGRSCPDN